ncbi:MAG: divergent PAP2 family protein [Spirochaeta sp.]|jgi:acid phosphatase family membrane protein YuiD|nr:divergent PAP2 family protein [Spirochaeta sp.]
MDLNQIAAMTVRQILGLPLITALLAQLSAQALKVVIYSVTERRLALDRFVNAAGIPSAHSAFVVALSASIGLRSGFLSDIFAVSFVFAAIVVYDSFRLRGHVQRHAEVLNQLLKPRLEADPTPRSKRSRRKDGVGVSEHVGHTIPEVVAGIIWGLMFAIGL